MLRSDGRWEVLRLAVGASKQRMDRPVHHSRNRSKSACWIVSFLHLDFS